MTESVETIEPDRSIREAAQMMLENKFGCLPVVEGLRVVGIVTESDFVRHLAAMTLEPEEIRERIRDFVTSRRTAV